jgi:hypothetical protein
MFIEYRRQLPELLRLLNLPMVAVECGSAEGRFAVELLNSGIEKLYLVDAWRQLNQAGDGGFDQSWHDGNYQQMLERTKAFGDKVVILRGLSHEMAEHIPDESLGLVYIDADHSYEGCMRDLESYYNKVVDGGIVAGHDFLNMAYGVNRAAKQFCEEMKIEINVVPDEHESMASFWFIKQ